MEEAGYPSSCESFVQYRVVETVLLQNSPTVLMNPEVLPFM